MVRSHYHEKFYFYAGMPDSDKRQLLKTIWTDSLTIDDLRKIVEKLSPPPLEDIQVKVNNVPLDMDMFEKKAKVSDIVKMCAYIQ